MGLWFASNCLRRLEQHGQSHTGILGGICFSINAGDNWSETECGQLPPLPHCPESYVSPSIIAASPGQLGVLLSGIDYTCNQQEKLGGIYRSTDYGETWTFITTTQTMWSSLDQTTSEYSATASHTTPQTLTAIPFSEFKELAQDVSRIQVARS